MTKSELIQQLAEKQARLPHSDVQLCVDLLLGAITESLGAGRRVEIRGFGSFSRQQQAPRLARNPKTGERIEVPAKYTPRFKAGNELRNRVNQLES